MLKFRITLFYSLLMLLPSCGLFAQLQTQVLQGYVFNADDQPIAGAAILLDQSKRVIYTNRDGFFEIRERGESQSLLIKAVGYESRNISLQYNYRETLMIYLSAATPSPFNADSIISKVISRRVLNELHYTAYSGEMYKKNTAFISRVPFEIPVVSGKYVPDKGDIGLVYAGESYSRVEYKDKNTFYEEVEAHQIGGSLMIKDWNYLNDFDLQLYHNKIYFEDISSRGYYSPIGSSGKSYYYYTPLGVYYEQDRKVYVIGFSPQRPYEAVLQGVIGVYDSSYTLAFADFNISPETQLEFVDSIHVVQQYGIVNDAYAMLSQNISFRIDILGYGGTYHVDKTFQNFRYTSPDSVLVNGSCVKHLDSNDIRNSRFRWNDIRPQPLDSTERHVLVVENNNAQLLGEYPETERAHFEEFRWKTYKLLYNKYYRRFGDLSYEIDPLYYALGYNTVEGFYLRYDLPITMHQAEGDLTITPEVRYGFADERGKYRLKINWFYDLGEPNEFTIEGGHTYAQFNEDEPILPVINSFYSLFLGNNFLKLYQKDYAKISHKWELFNGFDVSGSFEYAYRQPVYDRTDFTLTGNPDNFTFNNINRPPIIFSNGFRPHYALTGELSLSYHFNQLYELNLGRKKNLNVRSPMLYVNYRKGFGKPFGETNYDFLSGGVNASFRVGNIGVSTFDLSGGIFLNRAYVPFVDYKHFDGIQTFFLQPTVERSAFIKQFSTLPYYDYSSNNRFIEFHFEHDFDGFLFSKSRYLRYSNIHSLIGFNYLNNYTQSQFLEFFVGVDNVFHAIRIEFAGGIENFAKFSPSLRFGIDFDYLHYRKNRIKF